MSKTLDNTVPISDLPGMPEPAPPREPADPSSAGMRVVDENGDAIFRFRLRPPDPAAEAALNDFYRAQIYDLLKIVRLYSKGRPVLVDAFAFRNEPGRIEPLQPRLAKEAADGEK